MINLSTALLFGIFAGGLFFHELGHYLTAKVFGYQPSFSLKKFAVGFTDDLTRGRVLIVLSGVFVQSAFILAATTAVLALPIAAILTVAMLPMGMSDFQELANKSRIRGEI